MVSVGVLAAILNIITLTVAVLAERAIELIIRSFSVSRLKSTRRAPVVHDSDAWLFNLPRSIYKYYRYPAILFTLICGFLLISSEMISELGVDVSKKCRVRKMVGPVIRPGDIQIYGAEVVLVAAAVGLQQMKFEDGVFTYLPSGIPKNLNSYTCISCVKPKKEDIIMGNCTSTEGKTYPAGSLYLGTRTSTGAFHVIVVGFNETTAGNDLVINTFSGSGDFVYNGSHCAAFLFINTKNPTNQSEFTYFEYAHQEHCNEILSETTTDDVSQITTEGQNLWEKTRGPVTSEIIKCETNVLYPESFRSALRTYRSMQLENVLMSTKFNESTERFQKMTLDDIYRTGLSLKLAERRFIQGEYFNYTECGKYNFKFLIPLLVILALLVLLHIIASYQAMQEPRVTVPYNSRTWFDELLKRANNVSTVRSEGSPRHMHPFQSWKCDEMVLVGNNTKDMIVDYFSHLSGSKAPHMIHGEEIGENQNGQDPCLHLEDPAKREVKSEHIEIEACTPSPLAERYKDT